MLQWEQQQGQESNITFFPYWLIFIGSLLKNSDRGFLLLKLRGFLSCCKVLFHMGLLGCWGFLPNTVGSLPYSKDCQVKTWKWVAPSKQTFVCACVNARACVSMTSLSKIHSLKSPSLEVFLDVMQRHLSYRTALPTLHIMCFVGGLK